jgi:hypothetical protein
VQPPVPAEISKISSPDQTPWGRNYLLCSSAKIENSWFNFTITFTGKTGIFTGSQTN